MAGNLGSIDAQYDTAITTACPVLDYFVVETTTGGQKCLNFLRTIGARAKFVVLEEVRAAWEYV